MIHIHELDRILMEKYYPPIKRALEETEYPYSAEEFAGMIPGLTIQPSVHIPAQDTCFHITLEAGSGMTSGPWTLDQGMIGNIEETIAMSVEMYEATIGGFETVADVDAIIALAERYFGAS